MRCQYQTAKVCCRSAEGPLVAVLVGWETGAQVKGLLDLTTYNCHLGCVGWHILSERTGGVVDGNGGEDL